MSQETQMLLGLVLGIAVMIVLVMKTKTHTFIALLLAAAITGLVGGMTPSDAVSAISSGFGNTLASTGIIIGLGVMLGGILEKTGAAERLAYTAIKKIGSGKEEWALGITGWIVSIPVFADSALVIFRPLTKALSRVTGKSVIGLALALACGLQCTHTMVPPTPGPLTAAGMMGVDVGQMILVGAALSIPILIASVLYSKWIGKKIYQIPNLDGTYDRKEFKKEYLKKMDQLDSIMDIKNLPGLWPSVAPILVPLLLIFLKTGISLTTIQSGPLYYVISLLGEPIVALAIGTTLAVYGLGRQMAQKEVINVMNESIKDTGIIMLITGAGGALGLAPVLLAQACCIGAFSFGYFNDSGFWVFNGMFGLTEMKDQLKCKTAVSMIMAGVGVVELMIINLFL